MTTPQTFAPGLRIEVRDAEWRIRKVDLARDGGHLLTCEGLSELVRGRESVFWTELEDQVRVLDPAETQLVHDTSAGYGAGLLYLDTVLRKSPPTDERLAVAQNAAMDVLPFQLDPTLQALRQPRPRILIADSVGLGKTLEAGILISELIARGRGNRILVLAVKSMLAQFQRELWSRFTIPLVRLDSAGLQRVRSRIPTNHNPFSVFDRAIISIDTLKQDLDYRHHLEGARWDIIVIDEAHNVADRNSGSQRSKLAKLLATRSDTLILLSATPHDGKAESFASLVNMLDPTAIANPKDYTHEDFKGKGLVIRRFKHDVRDQLKEHFPERRLTTEEVPASPMEEVALSRVRAASFRALDGSRPAAGQLFRTTLEKALLSSPAACLSTIEQRLKKLAPKVAGATVAGATVAGTTAAAAALQADIDTLTDLKHAVAQIDPKRFSKYQALIRLLSPGKADLGWNPKQEDDRLVIFTESLKTLAFLQAHLPKDLGLKADAVVTLSGDMRDTELMAIVEDWGRAKSPARLMLCSDVASEGLNLHHLCHRLIHFDIPWSLMVFQQRNGRIDRYGQRRVPEIHYLATRSMDPQVAADLRVLDVLIAKDEQAGVNLGDPSAFMGLFSQADEEAITAAIMERDKSESDDIGDLFAELIGSAAAASEAPLAAFTQSAPPSTGLDHAIRAPRRLFSGDLAYADAALRWLRESGARIEAEVGDGRLAITPPPDLEVRLRGLPHEAQSESGRLVLSPVKERIEEELRRRRDETSLWPELQYLWPLHPVMEWLGDRALNAFGRHTAPVLRSAQLQPGEHLVWLQGGFPNRRGHILVHGWVVARFVNGRLDGTPELPAVLDRLKLAPGTLANRGGTIDAPLLQQSLAPAVAVARERLGAMRAERAAQLAGGLAEHQRALLELKGRHLHVVQQELFATELSMAVKQRREAERSAQIDAVFADHASWLADTQTLEPEPYIQVVAVFIHDGGTRA